MSTTTANLGLFKYNTTTDANVAFSINTALNDNWDKIDVAMAGGGLPDQTGKAGYILTTNGSEASWRETGEIHTVIETYHDGTDWYRIYSDGWCEQGGLSEGAAGNRQITFLVPFADTNYIIKTGTRYSTGANIYATGIINTSLTSTSYTQYNPYAYGSYWEACGYIAEE